MTDSDLIACWLKKHGATVCPPAVMTPSDHIDPAKLQPEFYRQRGAEVLPFAEWSKARARSKAARSVRRLGISDMKTNRIGAKI